MLSQPNIVWFPNAPGDVREASTDGRAEVARKIVQDAQEHAPVRTGEFRDSMHVTVSGEDVDIVDDDPAAFFIEYGTIDTPPAGVITQAAQREGTYHGKTPR